MSGSIFGDMCLNADDSSDTSSKKPCVCTYTNICMYVCACVGARACVLYQVENLLLQVVNLLFEVVNL